MNDSVQRLVELIHASPTEATIVVAGAGGQAVAWLLAVPGASRTILEALVPYGKRSMLEFLGHEPARYVSPETARKMAEVAYRRALHLLEDPVPSPPSSAKSVGDEVTTAEEIPGGLGERVVGLACTASIATDRPKRGEHRCCVATWNHAGVTIYDLKYAKGQRDRPGEEDVASRLVLRALAKSCGIDFELPLGLLETESLDVRYTKHADPLRRLLASPGDTEWGRGLGIVTVYPDGGMAVDEPLGNAAVLPGSFSPLHWGHELLAKVASEMLAIQAVFELSVVNVDKPLLAEREVRRRLSSFRGRWQVVLTRAPTFHEKAVLFPGCTFVIGWDTAARLVEPRYYGGQNADMDLAFAKIREEGCRFLVAGRVDDGGFRTLADVAIPREFTDLFEAIPESRFRADVSSTELRSTPTLQETNTTP